MLDWTGAAVETFGVASCILAVVVVVELVAAEVAAETVCEVPVWVVEVEAACC